MVDSADRGRLPDLPSAYTTTKEYRVGDVFEAASSGMVDLVTRKLFSVSPGELLGIVEILDFEDPIAVATVSFWRDGAQSTGTFNLRACELRNLAGSEWHVDPTTGRKHFIPSATIINVEREVPHVIRAAVINSPKGRRNTVPLCFLDCFKKVHSEGSEDCGSGENPEAVADLVGKGVERAIS